jgi:hypothetical protein
MIVMWIAYYYFFCIIFATLFSWFLKYDEKIDTYNNYYLWLLFRKNAWSQDYMWLETKETLDALDFYIDNMHM